MGERERTTISRKWSAKMALFLVGLTLFGSWGLYDATIHYPRRGLRAAEFNEWQYLRTALDPVHSFEVGGRVGVAQPAEVRAELKSRERALLSPVESARLDWLDALAVIGKLEERRTVYGVAVAGEPRPSAPERLRELDANWTTTDGKPLERPTALQWFDLPSQWLIAFVCYTLALYLLWLIIKVRAKTFFWEPAEKRLHLPGGHAIVPGDIAEFDKSKWHKFFVTLRIKPSHATLASKGVTLDLLRYQPLEEWVLAMEAALAPPPAPSTPPDAAPTLPASEPPTENA